MSGADVVALVAAAFVTGGLVAALVVDHARPVRPRRGRHREPRW